MSCFCHFRLMDMGTLILSEGAPGSPSVKWRCTHTCNLAQFQMDLADRLQQEHLDREVKETDISPDLTTYLRTRTLAFSHLSSAGKSGICLLPPHLGLQVKPACCLCLTKTLKDSCASHTLGPNTSQHIPHYKDVCAHMCTRTPPPIFLYFALCIAQHNPHSETLNPVRPGFTLSASQCTPWLDSQPKERNRGKRQPRRSQSLSISYSVCGGHSSPVCLAYSGSMPVSPGVMLIRGPFTP